MHCVHYIQPCPHLLPLLLSFMSAGVHKCCITAICWTVPCPIHSGIAMARVKRRKTDMFLNIAACVNMENHLRCLKDYPSNLMGDMCERG